MSQAVGACAENLAHTLQMANRTNAPAYAGQSDSPPQRLNSPRSGQPEHAWRKSTTIKYIKLVAGIIASFRVVRGEWQDCFRHAAGLVRRLCYVHATTKVRRPGGELRTYDSAKGNWI